MQLAPRGEQVLIGSEEVEVWVHHCVNGHHCFQCYLNGKIKCAPRFWFYEPVVLPPEPSHWRGSYEQLISLDTPSPVEIGGTLGDKIVGQPTIPIPDGGFTEEATDALISRYASERRRRYSPCRLIDKDCERCGYAYLSLRSDGTKNREHKDIYQCPKCGRKYMEDRKEMPKISEEARTYLRELREQGITVKRTIELIVNRYGVMSETSYYRIIKGMGLPARGQGNFR